MKQSREMQVKMTRIVYVVDQAPEKYEMIARICEENGWLVGGFSEHQDFVNWFDDQCAFPTMTEFACCIVMDISVLKSLSERRLPEAIYEVPKIYVGKSNFSCELRKLSWVGFFDFVEAPFDSEHIQATVKRALDRHEYLQSSTLGVAGRFEQLSKREYEVGALVVTGMTNQEIGDKLGISIKTVKAHRAKVMKKTHSETLVQLVRHYDIYHQVKTSRKVVP